MTKVRFIDDQLVIDGKNEAIPIKKEELRRECLKNEKNTLSIKSIIDEAVSNLGYKIIWSTSPVAYSKSDLYLYLEREINADANYKEMKRKVILEQNAARNVKRQKKVDSIHIIIVYCHFFGI